MNIPANRLDRGFYQYQDEFEAKALEVLRSGWYVLGKEVAEFEKEFAAYCGAKYCVGLASGLDALWIAFRVLGIGEGDEVIVQGNTYIASVMGITINGATPVFVEPDAFYNIDVTKIEEKITERTKAILVVHLYGQASNMTEIMRLAEKYNLRVVEDCAQSHGAKWNGQMTGTFGDVGCFSFYPSKNLGAFGDGGAVVINDEVLDKKFRVFRNYGSEKRYHNMIIGANSRLDEMQAALLRVRLAHLDEINAERADIAAAYTAAINNEKVLLPQIRTGASSVFHQYVVRTDDRDKFMNYLQDRGIGTIIHYPIPPHLAEAYQYLGYEKGAYPITEAYADTVLSLPMYTGMTQEEIKYVIDVINEYK
ncbi:MAG: DegT/DnrJ/EryC1/StrS family aminotransferase [Peptococcaceae bacterium]|nr:DegT/DnrJ/EryC1/StrS family aminotransferase [Peptococcaceae bacterium]MBQ6887037.1 DegT/DnrJ/EryC1/StrS family aminotransferase [Lachnospiraceae bacterium]